MYSHICRILALSKATVFIAEMWVLVESPSSWLARSENMPRMRLDRQRGLQLVVNRPRMPEVMVQFYLSGDKLLCTTASKHKTTLLQRQRRVPSLEDITFKSWENWIWVHGVKMRAWWSDFWLKHVKNAVILTDMGIGCDHFCISVFVMWHLFGSSPWFLASGEQNVQAVWIICIWPHWLCKITNSLQERDFSQILCFDFKFTHVQFISSF